MQSFAIIVALAAVASASAVAVVDLHAYPQYKFDYGVADKHTGDQKTAHEIRDGGVTKGGYSLIQPDGVLRQVLYTVTPHGGFQAQVINKGVAGHPAYYHAQGHGQGLGHAAAGHGGLHYGGHAIGHGISFSSGLGSPVFEHHGYGYGGLLG